MKFIGATVFAFVSIERSLENMATAIALVFVCWVGHDGQLLCGNFIVFWVLLVFLG